MNFLEQEAAAFRSTLQQESGAQLIDVREPYEHENGNISGSINIPMGEILSRLEELEAVEPIMVYCKSGTRSKTVAYHLSSKLPNKTIISLKGGFEAYNG